MNTTSKDRHLYKIEELLARISSADLAIAVVEILKSTKFDINERRRMMAELAKFAKPLPELTIYSDKAWTTKQYAHIKQNGWVDFVPALIEIAHSFGGDVDNIILNLDCFLKGTGIDHLTRMHTTPFKKGVIGALLMLGGYEFKSVRDVVKGFKRVLSPIKGTELLNLQNRVDMAMQRCHRLGLITGE